MRVGGRAEVPCNKVPFPERTPETGYPVRRAGTIINNHSYISIQLNKKARDLPISPQTSIYNLMECKEKKVRSLGWGHHLLTKVYLKFAGNQLCLLRVVLYYRTGAVAVDCTGSSTL